MPAALQFRVDAPGLTAVVNADGQVVFSDAAGVEVARMTHPGPWTRPPTRSASARAG